MGCIQPKKIIKVSNQSQKESSKSESNNIAIHNIRKDTNLHAILCLHIRCRFICAILREPPEFRTLAISRLHRFADPCRKQEPFRCDRPDVRRSLHEHRQVQSRSAGDKASAASPEGAFYRVFCR